jgi:FAD/FMN-containing dehydrogenase
MTDFSSLRHDLHGSLLEPSDDGFAEALLGFNLLVTHSPEAVVIADDAVDVDLAVRFAHEHGLPVRAVTTGHSAPAAHDGIVIRLDRLNSVSIDPQTRLATLGGGVTWGAVVEAGAPLGLAPITGSSDTVGAVGFVLGGGLGPLARSHGFGSDWVRGFSVVTGTGEVLAATEHDNPELFWALRGGKGGLGIVVEMLLELAPIPELFGGNAVYPASDIEAVVRAWADYTRIAPADATTSVAIVRMPPFEQVPERLRGQTVVFLRYARPASEPDAAFAAVRGAGTPLMNAIRPLPLAEIATVHADPPGPSSAWAGGVMLSSMGDALVSTLLEHAGAGVESPLTAVELRHLGSTTQTDVAGGSAVGGRESEYVLTLIGTLGHPGTLGAVTAATDAIFGAVAPWTAASTTINFAVPGRALDEFRTSWPVETWERLAAIRAEHDPDGVFPFGPVA